MIISDLPPEEWAFSYFKVRKSLDCEFPCRFNGKTVIGFDESHRPIGMGGVDLITEYWETQRNNTQMKNLIKFLFLQGGEF